MTGRVATARYVARDGKVYVRKDRGWREVTSALTSNGRDLERFEAARLRAAAQRSAGS